MGVMATRRFVLSVLVSVCVLGSVLVGGTGSAWAAGGSFLFGPIGKEAGQIFSAVGMAVDQQSGDVYVSDPFNQRIDEFDGSGEFVRAWGWGVIPPGEGANTKNEFQGKANEFQVCTNATGCGEGIAGSGVGQFATQTVGGVAVDNEPGAFHGDVYVQDGFNHRVQVFDSEGKFLRMFGRHVNKNGSDVCDASEAAQCQKGTEGVGDGEFEWEYKSIIAVGPGGNVYVGDKARVQVFEPSGVWKENISLSVLSTEGTVTALAVNAVGDVFVKVKGVLGVHGFEPDGVEMLTQFDQDGGAIGSLVVDSAGDLFIAEKEGEAIGGEKFVPCNKCAFLEYSPSGVELENFGGGVLATSSSAMVFDETLGEMLEYGDNDYEESGYGLVESGFGVFAFPVPSPGPLVESGSEKSAPEPRGAVMLEALVNPEGSSTEVKFEYVDKTDFNASGYADAVSTTPAVLGETGFNDEHVEVRLPEGTLVAGGSYHWRVVAHSSVGTNPGLDQSFEEIPAAEIEGPWATSVTSSSVTLGARVDPLGVLTSYRLEYGSSTGYGHVFSGNVGDGNGYVTIGYHVQELEPGVVYHYRLVSENAVGMIVGTDRTFTTQTATGELRLPDGRAWELVSPPDKGGALIESIEQSQAASDGGAIVYSASEPLGEVVVGHESNPGTPTASATVISSRGVGGWRTRDISPKQTLLPEGQTQTNLTGGAEAFMTFTPDLSLGVLEPRDSLAPARQSSDASEPTLYVRDNTNETYEPLVTDANVPPGTKWYNPAVVKEYMEFDAATPDLSHIVFGDRYALTPEAITGSSIEGNLYEWSGGQLQLVNIIPNESSGREEPVPGAAFGTNLTESGGVGAANPWAMSADGRWIVFRYGEIAELGGGSFDWYVRDMVGHRTVAFGRPKGKTLFETMSRDGSKLFYLEPEGEYQQNEGELYVLDPANGVKTDLTADHLDGERSAGVQNMLVGSSEDGSFVYFVAKGVLGSGAVEGGDNLYVMREDGSEWKTTFIATLSNNDEKDWSVGEDDFHQVEEITSRVTPDGRYVTFMSDKSLTGYDNVDAVSGQPDEEVYLYDAETDRLVCASCNPSGARPVGVDDVRVTKNVLMDQSGAWSGHEEAGYEGLGHWLAASIAPDWHVNWYAATHRVNYLSDEGRLFFNSSDALVPQDTNGLADVYEYEPPGVGDCTSTSTTFSERSGGCVSLISSGQSSSESTFLEASESGDDVFFITAAKLVGEDYDNVNDVYDAHVCSVSVGCPAVSVSPPPCTSGDSCKAAPSPQPAIFGPAPSATFDGTGNVTNSSPGVGVKPKSLTNAQKLAGALKVCRKKRPGKKRSVCEARARKRYPVKRSKAKVTRKGAR